MAAKNPGLPSGGLLRTSGQALVRPIPSASPRRGLRRPRAAIQNPNPRRPTLACKRGPRPDPGLARASIDGALSTCLSCLAAGPPVAGSWTPVVRPAVTAVPADPLRDPRDPDRRPGSPRPRGSVDAVPSRCTGLSPGEPAGRLEGNGVATFRPACAVLPATAPAQRPDPVLPAPPPFRGRLLPVDRVLATGHAGEGSLPSCRASLSLTGNDGLKAAHRRQSQSPAHGQNLVDGIPR